jgi:hypothetical protein
VALGTICRRKRKPSVRGSLMLIAFDRDRSDVAFVALQLNLGLALVDSQWPSNF